MRSTPLMRSSAGTLSAGILTVACWPSFVRTTAPAAFIWRKVWAAFSAETFTTSITFFPPSVGAS